MKKSLTISLVILTLGACVSTESAVHSYNGQTVEIEL